MEKILENKKYYIVIIALLALLAGVSLVQGCRNAAEASQDFQWDAVKTFTLKINPYDESLNPSGILDNYGFDEYYLQMEANQFPSLLMILIPFTWLPPLAARYVWLAFNIFLTAAMAWLLRKTFLKDLDIKEYSILFLLMIAGTPYRNHLGVGQHTIFAFTFFLLAVYLSEYCEALSAKENSTKKNAARIILVSMCLFVCYFKYTLTVPLVLFFIYKKRYIEIFISVIMHIILTVVAAFWLNDSVINMIIKPLKVSSALATEGGLDISAIFKGSAIAYVLLLIIMLMLLYLSLKLMPGFDVTLISALILWSLIITYHRTYDFFVIIIVPALFYELKRTITNSETKDYAVICNLYRYSYVVIVAVFFVLRAFSENTFSKIIVGTLYYILTFLVTGVIWYVGLNRKKEN